MTVRVLKSQLSELAVLGGKPAFRERLHVGRPNIGNHDRIVSCLKDILDRRWLTNNGPYVEQLEARIQQFLAVKHCVVMCNGTVALEIAIRAAELRGEVIVPSFTFVATAHALQWQEITPVFCDIEAETHAVDPNRIEELITPRTTGVIGVHIWGRPCKVEAITELTKRHSLKLLFDSAHAFGCSHAGRMIGNFGDAEVFSFHATKFFNTYEGGAVTTNDDNLASKVRLMRNFGFVDYDKVAHIGTNGKMNEVAAATGLVNLDSMDEFVAANYRNYKAYERELSGIRGLRVLPYNGMEKHNYQYIVLEIAESVTKISRDELMGILWAENIVARRYFYPGCHRMEPYRSYFPHARLLLRETERVSERVILLPTGTCVEDEDVAAICAVIRLSVENGKELAFMVRNGVKARGTGEMASGGGTSIL